MEEAVCVNDFVHCADLDPSQMDHLDTMDFNMVSSLLELNDDDLSEINQMVDDWEFNFGSLEVSEGEELLNMIDNMPSQLYDDEISPPPPPPPPPPPAPAPLQVVKNEPAESTFPPEQLHDRLPSYYTACATSKTAPWIPSCNNQQLFNKLPAYITDVATVVEPVQEPPQVSLAPAKKKLNLAEYRSRQKMLQEQKLAQVKDEPKTEPMGKSPKRPIKKSEEPEEGEVDDEDESSDEPARRRRSRTPKRRNVKRSRRESSSSSSNSDDSSDSTPRKGRSRFRSSRSPTRSSYSSRSRSSSRRRYRSSSASSSSSSSSYSSRSRSRSPYNKSRRRRYRRSRSRSPAYGRYNRRRRTPTPPSYSSASSSSSMSSSSRGYYSSEARRRRESERQAERQRQIDERRVIYVGKLAEGTTRADLRKRFEVFGPVIDISLHFRERGDNYGFVTFAYKVDAYEAVEHGNDDPTLPKYDLSFGGRRAFCKTSYADLDAVDEDEHSKGNEVDFETLLKTVRAQLHQRRPCS